MKKLLTGLAFLLCFSIVLTAGCIGNTNTLPESVSQNAPILGTWQAEYEDGDEFDLVYQFNADGTVTEIWYFTGTKTVDETINGKWAGNNSEYSVNYDAESDRPDDIFILSSDGSMLTDGYGIVYFRP